MSGGNDAANLMLGSLDATWYTEYNVINFIVNLLIGIERGHCVIQQNKFCLIVKCDAHRYNSIHCALARVT